ncbi:hypothetical protein QU38_01755, partial [Staphylococcus aureus]
MGGEQLEILLVEDVADPAIDVEVRAPPAETHVRERIGIDPSIGRRRRVGREFRTPAAVIAEIDIAIAHRLTDLAAPA